MKIYKYPLLITDKQEVILPRYASILSVQMQKGQLYLWAMVTPDNTPEPRIIKIIGTGNPFELTTNLTFISTVQSDPFVWHVFEEEEKK